MGISIEQESGGWEEHSHDAEGPSSNAPLGGAGRQVKFNRVERGDGLTQGPRAEILMKRGRKGGN